MNLFLEQLLCVKADRPSETAFSSNNGQVVSYQELARQVQFEFAPLFHQLGWEPGSLVAILCPRSVFQYSLIAALLACEIVPLTLDGFTTSLEFADILDRLPVAGAISRQPCSKKTRAERKIGALHAASFIQSRRIEAGLALMTSGSTGKPKPVLISGQDLKNRALAEIRDFGVTEASQIHNVLPLSHDLGLNQLLSSFFAGAELNFISSLFANDLVQTISQKENGWMTGTPFFWKHAMPFLDGRKLTSLRCLTVSGGQLDLLSQERLLEIFPEARLLKTYGQTETFRSLLSQSERGRLEPHLGRALTGVSLNQIENGELCHSGDGVMLGYLDDDESTRRKRIDLQREDLPVPTIRTGDIFDRDKAGNFVFRGRSDRMMKRLDYRIYPEQIEAFLSAQPTIAAAHVYQDPDLRNRWDDRLLIAEIQVADSQAFNEDGILRLCKEHLGPTLVPDKIIRVESVKFTETYKVKRAQPLDA